MKILTSMFKRRPQAAAHSPARLPTSEISASLANEIIEAWREENTASENADAAAVRSTEANSFGAFLANFRSVIRADCDTRGVRFNVHKANLMAREAWEVLKLEEAKGGKTASISKPMNPRIESISRPSPAAPIPSQNSSEPKKELFGLARTREAIRGNLAKHPPKRATSAVDTPAAPVSEATKTEPANQELHGLALVREAFRKNREAAAGRA